MDAIYINISIATSQLQNLDIVVVLLLVLLGWAVCVPVKGACKDEIVVCRELLEASLEVSLVDQASGLVDDDEGVNNPGVNRSVSLCECAAASPVELSAHEGQLTLRSVCSHYGFFTPAEAPPKYNVQSRNSVVPPSAFICSLCRLVGFCFSSSSS